jgi:hypothetical protein
MVIVMLLFGRMYKVAERVQDQMLSDLIIKEQIALDSAKLKSREK